MVRPAQHEQLTASVASQGPVERHSSDVAAEGVVGGDSGWVSSNILIQKGLVRAAVQFDDAEHAGEGGGAGQDASVDGEGDGAIEGVDQIGAGGINNGDGGS